jgi:hypothetical protein
MTACTPISSGAECDPWSWRAVRARVKRVFGDVPYLVSPLGSAAIVGPWSQTDTGQRLGVYGSIYEIPGSDWIPVNWYAGAES